SSKQAYKINPLYRNHLALVWNVPSSDRNVFVTPSTDLPSQLDEHYWIVEPFQNGYVFKNKRDSNLVLDVVRSVTS
ncbi:hypothetical protein VJ282_33675, partial [Bacillus mycoides]